MKIKRKIIEIDEELCDGCGQCVPSCAEGSLKIVDGKAKLVADRLCDGLGACLGECPQGALQIVEREAEEFDETAVEAYLAAQEDDKPESPPLAAGGCPSAGVRMFAPATGEVHTSKAAAAPAVADTALTHWPIQIRLVPPTAPFLKGAHLLVLADCGAVAYPRLHKDFLQDKVVLMGCPKFDDVPMYVERFADIFRQAGIRQITTVYMEVPCCSALPKIVEKAMAVAGRKIPMEEVVIGVRGQVQEPDDRNAAMGRIA